MKSPQCMTVDAEPACALGETILESTLRSSRPVLGGRDQNPDSDSSHHLPDSPTSIRGSVLQSKSKQLRLSWILALGTFSLAAFSTFYSWSVLISDNPALGSLQSLSPGKTLWIVNILSQAVAFSVCELLSMVFEALRWALASGESGILISTFLALSRATPLLGVVSLCSINGTHRLWCTKRYCDQNICSLKVH